MNRLTIKFPNGYLLQEPKTEDGALAYINAITEKLGKLEDAEEQGLLLKLPCKVGDKVYRFWYVCETPYKVQEQTIKSLSQVVAIMEDSSFGKEVFLTREEAEKALAELNNKTEC